MIIAGVLICIKPTWHPTPCDPEYTGWMPDEQLWGDFQQCQVYHCTDYTDYPVRSTVIRLNQPGDSAVRRGVLYVHGFNDYFFQSAMARRFADSLYRFYAVDLRKYGRSMQPWDHPFQLRNIAEYFPDIDAAVHIMTHEGVDTIILMGHSTGGLTTACYMNHRPDTAIRALILNSPFLDWNLSPMLERVGVPVVSAIGEWLPDMKISQGASTTYSHSLLKKYDGEWTYDTTLKFIQSPDVTAGWINAITEAQRSLRDGRSHIDVPVLLLHSDASAPEGATMQQAQRSDAVLDVADIDRYGRQLGPDVTVDTIPGGMHDLVLSAPAVRTLVYADIFTWLRRQGL